MTRFKLPRKTVKIENAYTDVRDLNNQYEMSSNEGNRTFDRVEKLNFADFRAEFECTEMKVEDW